MERYIQRRVGLILGLTAVGASLVQLLASLHTFDLNLGEALLLPSVLFVFGTGVFFLVTALLESKAFKTIQLAVIFLTGYGSCLGITSGNLTYLIFFGLGFFLAMEYGFLDRHVVSKALIALGLLLTTLTYGMIFLNKLSPLVIVHSLIGASAVISVSYLLFKVSLRRYRDQKKSLEEIIEDRTRKLQEELSRVSELKDDLEDQLEENRNLLSVNENLLREVLHRTKNNMQLISSFLNLESAQYDEPHLQAIFEKTVQRIGTLAISHELLYSKAKNLSFLNLKAFMEKLGDRFCRDLSGCEIALTMEVPAEIEIDLDLATPLGLLVNELLSNVEKHAFRDRPAGSPGELHIRVFQSDRTISFVFQDNGIGIPEAIDIERPETLGLRLISAFVEQAGGQLSLQREGGTTWTFIFPLSDTSSVS